MIAYKLVRQWSGNWMFAGTTPEQVAETVKNEIEADDGLSVDERGAFQIASFEITQKQLDEMPEFPGW